MPYHHALCHLYGVDLDQMDLMTSAHCITAVRWEPGQSWVGINGWTSGGRFTSMSSRRQNGFSRRVHVQTSSGESGRRCILVLMPMAGWYHACLGQSGIRRRADALDIRSFLTTAAMSSTGGQSSRVSSRDQCDTNSLWHWRRRKTGCSPTGRRRNESRGAVIPFATESRSVCLTAGSPGEKSRDSASAFFSPRILSTLTMAGAQARLAPSSSD
jgi:hypothetical protein